VLPITLRLNHRLVGRALGLMVSRTNDFLN